MRLQVKGIPTDQVEHIRSGGPDAHGQRTLVRVAEGVANPCRHCLGLIAEGDRKLIFAYRPFANPQPYAEIGPIFLHERACERYESDSLPSWFAFLDPAIIRGYDSEDWILYETGQVASGAELDGVCRDILENPKVSYVHIRSKYNCFQCRVDRVGDGGRS